MRSSRISTTFFVLLMAAAHASAATFYVRPNGSDAQDGQSWQTAKATLPAAITLAASGDQIWVSAGTYVGRIQLRNGVALYGGFSGTETDLAQRNWTTNVTVLDANKTGSVIAAGTATSAATRVDGFTIRNGQTSGSGGAISCNSAAPTITNNVISGNTASNQGGAIACPDFSTPLITNNTITGNTGGQGGGISISNASPTVSNNIITGNHAGSGGGLYSLGNYAAPTITGNTVAGNVVSEFGGGIHFGGGSGLFSNNRILGNSSTNSGGGLSLLNSSPTIINNVIAANTAKTGGGIYNYFSSGLVGNNTVVGNAGANGGGAYIQGSSPTYANNIVAFNTSGFLGSGTTAMLQNNCVFNPLGANYASLSPGSGDVSADPKLLASSYGEVHLLNDSPCIDTGLDSITQPSWTDMDGQPRIHGPHVDIGADEFDGTAPAFSPHVVRVSTQGNDANDGSSWALSKRTVQAGIDAVTGPSGGEVWVSSGLYQERITLKLFARLYGGFAGTENARTQRDWIANVTTLDGQAVGAVVKASFMGLDASILDGFTIINGKAQSGGGFNCSQASPTVSHNVFTANLGTASGAGFYAENNCRAVVVSNSFVSNTGGAIQAQGAAPWILNNTIAGNTTNLNSGAISLYASSAVIANNIIAFNGAGINLAGTISQPVLRNNCVFNPGGTNYSGLSAGSGDISVDPLFVDRAAGNYHLSASSPSIDAASNSDVAAASAVTDLANHARQLDDPATPDCQWSAGSCGSAPVVDMGAYEFVPSIPGDFNADGFVDGADFTTFTACGTRTGSPYTPANLPQAAPGCILVPDGNGHIAADFDQDGDVDMSDFAILQRCYSGAHAADAACAN